MKPKFVNCFVFIGTALSLNNTEKLPEVHYPLIQEAAATLVNVSMTLLEMRFFDINSMGVAVDLLLHQRWLDPRLSANAATQKLAVARQIWQPKITAVKGVKGSCFENEDTKFWRGFGDEGNVLLSEKIKVQIFCTRNFRRFPFDSQICELKFGTYRFPIEEVKLQWHGNPVEVTMATDLNEFQLTNISVLHEVDVRPSGNYSVLVVQIVVTRYYLHYVICIIVPCMVLVLISYGSLWINHIKSELRVVSSLSVVLFLVYFYYVVTCSIVMVPFLKSVDIFVLLCLAFAGFSLFENCIVSFINIDTRENYVVNKNYEGNKNLKKAVMWIERVVKVMFLMLYIFCILLLLYCTL